ncbi:MAG: TonB-dependent receptor plug domain-containing protein [Balneolaceae bacterium]
MFFLSRDTCFLPVFVFLLFIPVYLLLFFPLASAGYDLNPPALSHGYQPEPDGLSGSRLPVQDSLVQDSLWIHPMADTLQLDEILIRSTRLPEPLRYQPVDIQHIDSLQLANARTLPISALLSRYSSLFIRDNGPGALALSSQRGLSAGQTQVLWDGFPVNSLSLGQTDLSLIPSALFNSVEVSPGTPSSAFGGGSLGGVIYLSPPGAGGKNHLELMQSAGAFGTWNSQLHATYGTGRWSVSLQGIYDRASNDFSYVNRASGREERRLNNAGRTDHLTGSVSYELTGGKLYSGIWYWNSREEIPGSILSASTVTSQENRGVRWLTGLETSAGNWNVTVRSFLEHDRFGYNDPGADIDSRFLKGRWLNNLDFRRPPSGGIVWQGGISGGLEVVDTNNYAGDYHRRLLGLRLNPEIRLTGLPLRLSPTARLDSYSGFGWVLSPSLGANWEVLKNRLHLKGMVSRDYNPPSFNDLYWIPGGNPDLEPERSVKTEGGFVYLPENPLFGSFNLTLYRIWLDNGIYWFPGRNGIWSPSNVEETDAYGIEGRLETEWRMGTAEFNWTIGADWRRSEIAKARFQGDLAVGRQMRYVPEWTARSNLGIRLPPVAVHVDYRWTDRRYTTEDHTSSLGDFQVLDLTVSAVQELFGADWQIRLSANNLLNERYEIIQWYPMPGRYLTLSAGLDLPL